MARGMTRRYFVATASAAACITLLRAQETVLPETALHISSTPGSRVPADFLGLSFPAGTLHDAAFLTPENISLVQQIRTLSPRGILRVAGGSTKLDGVDTKVIDNLDGFLKAIGWTCVYGLRTDGTPQAACEYISNRLGQRLNAFELSNNSDSSPQRAMATAKALQAAVPGIRFTLAADDFAPWTAAADRPALRAVSTTYARNSSTMLQPDAGMTADPGDAATALAAQTIRIAEASVTQPDTFAAALWSANAALQWMQRGYAAVCMRDGTVTRDGRTLLSTVGLGMKFSAAFLGATMLPVALDTVAANVTAYAAQRMDGKTIVAIFNMEAATQVHVTAPFFDTLQVLTALSLDARETHVSHIVSETGSHRTTTGQSFTLPPHMATLLVLR